VSCESPKSKPNEQRLNRPSPTHRPKTTSSKEDVRALVAALGDIVATLQRADHADKAAIYRELGSALTFHPEGTVRVEARLRVYSGACRR
jgi:hypothetical protein